MINFKYYSERRIAAERNTETSEETTFSHARQSKLNNEKEMKYNAIQKKEGARKERLENGCRGAARNDICSFFLSKLWSCYFLGRCAPTVRIITLYALTVSKVLFIAEDRNIFELQLNWNTLWCYCMIFKYREKRCHIYVHMYIPLVFESRYVGIIYFYFKTITFFI